MSGRRWIPILRLGAPRLDTARWCSGSTEDFGSSDPGSNPGRAAFFVDIFVDIGQPMGQWLGRIASPDVAPYRCVRSCYGTAVKVRVESCPPSALMSQNEERPAHRCAGRLVHAAASQSKGGLSAASGSVRILGPVAVLAHARGHALRRLRRITPVPPG